APIITGMAYAAGWGVGRGLGRGLVPWGTREGGSQAPPANRCEAVRCPSWPNQAAPGGSQAECQALSVALLRLPPRSCARPAKLLIAGWLADHEDRVAEARTQHRYAPRQPAINSVCGAQQPVVRRAEQEGRDDAQWQREVVDRQEGEAGKAPLHPAQVTPAEGALVLSMHALGEGVIWLDEPAGAQRRIEEQGAAGHKAVVGESLQEFLVVEVVQRRAPHDHVVGSVKGEGDVF